MEYIFSAETRDRLMSFAKHAKKRDENGFAIGSGAASRSGLTACCLACVAWTALCLHAMVPAASPAGLKKTHHAAAAFAERYNARRRVEKPDVPSPLEARDASLLKSAHVRQIRTSGAGINRFRCVISINTVEQS